MLYCFRDRTRVLYIYYVSIQVKRSKGSYKLCITNLEWKDIYVHSYYIMINFDSLNAKYLVLLTHKTFLKASKNSNTIKFALCCMYLLAIKRIYIPI